MKEIKKSHTAIYTMEQILDKTHKEIKELKTFDFTGVDTIINKKNTTIYFHFKKEIK